MTIEVTDEMIAAARDASIALTNHCSTYLETKASLEAVFAIVERDLPNVTEVARQAYERGQADERAVTEMGF